MCAGRTGGDSNTVGMLAPLILLFVYGNFLSNGSTSKHEAVGWLLGDSGDMTPNLINGVRDVDKARALYIMGKADTNMDGQLTKSEIQHFYEDSMGMDRQTAETVALEYVQMGDTNGDRNLDEAELEKVVGK
ncbi:hypothetical protein ScPMuIL_002820 [Solemya velum]